MDHVFIVTSGEYSDYGISGVYSTFEKASEQAFSENRKKGELSYYRVEIYPLDQEREEFKIWRVHEDNEGEWDCETGYDIEAPLGEVCRNYSGWYVWLKSDDEKQALKAGNDLISEFKAKENGI